MLYLLLVYETNLQSICFYLIWSSMQFMLKCDKSLKKYLWQGHWFDKQIIFLLIHTY